MLGKSLIKAAAGNAGAAGAVADPNFADTTLLLQGDTSNEAMLYNAFGDASSNAHDITAVGGVYGTPFSPYNNSWSVEFDGSDYLTLDGSSDFAMSTGDFTIEFWAFASSISGAPQLISFNPTSTNGAYPLIYLNSGVLTYYVNNTAVITGASVSANTWYHIAVSRSGTSTKMFLDGTQTGSTYTDTNNYLVGASRPIIARTGFNDAGYFTGSISNLRIVKGTALYTSNFTPSTTPLTDISGTSLLTCNANRFIDTSSNAHAITVNGDPEIKGFSPFTDTDTVTGSGYFDGSGEWLIVPEVGSEFTFGTGDFTIETWFNNTSTGTQVVTDWRSAGGNQGVMPTIYISGSTLYYYIGANIHSTAILLNQWYHVAIVKNSGTLTMYLNGASVGSGSDTNTYIAPQDGNIRIGALDATNDFFGYMSNFRVVKGTAIYTSAFTPPTSPLTAVSGTSLLTLQNRGANRNIGFIDSSHPTRVITRNGNVTQGSFSPFSQDEGKWSIYHDGGGNYLDTGSTSLFNYDSNSTFTMEAWVYHTERAASDPYDYAHQGLIYRGAVSYVDLNFGITDEGKVRLWHVVSNTGYFSDSTDSVPENTWTHIAAVVNSGTITFYVNGVSSGTGTWYGDNNNRTTYLLGHPNGTVPKYHGYVSNLRVSHVARSITPAYISEPFESDADTEFLAFGSNRPYDKSSNAHTWTQYGTFKTTPFSPFAPSTAYDPATKGGSGYFDGSGDYLQTTIGSTTIGSGDFSIEMWYYPITLQNFDALFSTTRGANGFNIGVNASNTVVWYSSSAEQINAGSITVNQWSHIAFTRTSNTLRLYVNGVQVGATPTVSTDFSATNCWIGDLSAIGGETANGYLSDIRIVKESLASGSSYTVPTAPLTAVSGTSLLCNFTNAGIYDGTGRNVLETVGDAQVDTAVKKYGTGSMQFDGTGDYLVVPGSEQLAFGTGDFTVEHWLYIDADVTQIIYDFRPASTHGDHPVLFYYAPDNKIYYQNQAVNKIVGSALSLNTWYHVAICRSGTSTKLFVDGTQVGSTYSDSSDYGCGRLVVGASSFTLGSIPFNGYIDDLRITKGVARYTANFTPPAAKLPNL